MTSTAGSSVAYRPFSLIMNHIYDCGQLMFNVTSLLYSCLFSQILNRRWLDDVRVIGHTAVMWRVLSYIWGDEAFVPAEWNIIYIYIDYSNSGSKIWRMVLVISGIIRFS